MRIRIGYILVLLTIVSVCGAATVPLDGDQDDSESERSSKFLPFLAVVSFQNTECDTMMDGTGKGVCYSKKQCTAKGGVASAVKCAEGYGICCSFRQTCPSGGGEVLVKNNLTVITGSTVPHSCKFVIPKQKGVCQIRLDFQKFDVGTYVAQVPITGGMFPPDPVYDPDAGECLTDKVAISGTPNLPNGLTLCGTAQDHVYLEYGNMDKITLDANIVSKGSYDIKVTMIKCNSPAKAPSGCTQYFTNRTSRVQSFNFPNEQLNNEIYSVCIANPDLAQKITWRACSAMPTGFFISGQTPGAAKSGPTDCTADYVLIPGSKDERYCGGNFTGPVDSNKMPFMLFVNFNEVEVPDDVNNPSDIIDPDTGCPINYACTVTPLTDTTKPCDDGTNGGVCIIKQYIAEMIDAFNTGFCLEYTLG